MSAQVMRLPEEAIVIAVIRPPVMWHFEIQEMFRRIVSLRNAIDDSADYFLILDIGELDATEFALSDMLFTLTEARRTVYHGRADVTVHLLLVCPEDLVEVAEKAMFQASFRKEEISLLETLDQAVNVARMELSLLSER